MYKGFSVHVFVCKRLYKHCISLKLPKIRYNFIYIYLSSYKNYPFCVFKNWTHVFICLHTTTYGRIITVSLRNKFLHMLLFYLFMRFCDKASVLVLQCAQVRRLLSVYYFDWGNKPPYIFRNKLLLHSRFGLFYWTVCVLVCLLVKGSNSRSPPGGARLPADGRPGSSPDHSGWSWKSWGLAPPCGSWITLDQSTKSHVECLMFSWWCSIRTRDMCETCGETFFNFYIRGDYQIASQMT